MPMSSHTSRRTQVITDRLTIRYRHDSTPRTGMTEPPGTLNGRCASGRVTRSTITARHDHDKGKQRPDAGHLADDLDRHEPRDDGDDDARDDRGDVRRLEPRMHLADALRQQAVAAHREEDPRLAHEHHEQHAGDAGHRARRHEAGRPVQVDHRQRVRDRRVQKLRVLAGTRRRARCRSAPRTRRRTAPCR